MSSQKCLSLMRGAYIGTAETVQSQAHVETEGHFHGIPVSPMMK